MNPPGSVSHKTILSYASNLAKFTSAPPSNEPLRPESIFEGSLVPPFPTVEMMRKGKMNLEAPLGSLGETREVGRCEPLTRVPHPASTSDEPAYAQRSPHHLFMHKRRRTLSSLMAGPHNTLLMPRLSKSRDQILTTCLISISIPTFELSALGPQEYIYEYCGLICQNCKKAVTE